MIRNINSLILSESQYGLIFLQKNTDDDDLVSKADSLSPVVIIKGMI